MQNYQQTIIAFLSVYSKNKIDVNRKTSILLIKTGAFLYMFRNCYSAVQFYSGKKVRHSNAETPKGYAIMMFILILTLNGGRANIKSHF